MCYKLSSCASQTLSVFRTSVTSDLFINCSYILSHYVKVKPKFIFVKHSQIVDKDLKLGFQPLNKLFYSGVSNVGEARHKLC